MIKRLVIALLMGCLSINLSGCGFQLRGYQGNNAQSNQLAGNFALSQLQLKADPANSFTQTLIEQMQGYGIKVHQDAEIRLDILRIKQQKRTLSYNNRAKGVEYQLIKKVRFRLLDITNNKTLIAATDMQSERTYLYDNTKIAAMKQQENAVLNALEFDLANNLLTLINSQLK